MDTYAAQRGTRVFHLPITAAIPPFAVVEEASDMEPMPFRTCDVVLRRPSTRHKCDYHDALILRPASFGESG